MYKKSLIFGHYKLDQRIMKKFFTILSTLAVMLISSQAIAKNMCHEVTHYKGLVDHLNKGLASKSAGGMAEGLKAIGVHPTKKEMSAGKEALKLMIQSQEGSLYTALKLAEAGCKAEKHVAKARKAGRNAYHHAKNIVHNIHHAIVSHRHLVCKHWGHGHSRHYACRWRG